MGYALGQTGNHVDTMTAQIEPAIPRVIVAEEDRNVSEPLAEALRREGYEVEVRENGPAVLEAAARLDTDLVVIDLNLPGMDGLEVTRTLRARGNDVPVLAVGSRADEVDIVVGLDAGADDFVAKPFRLAELLARVRALLRRGGSLQQHEPAEFRVGDVFVDVAARRAFKGDQELVLTAKEFDLLHALIRDVGKVVTRDQLMTEVWQASWWSSTKTLDMHVSWLRRKLGDDALHPVWITTVRGVGFRFAGPSPEVDDISNAD
jgi:DNA-binding response OmpR family regulator